MNDITATHPQSADVLWEKISSTINKVQKFTLENPLAKTKELLSHIPLDELIVDEVGSGISIVYRPYNRPAMELIARREWPRDEMNNTIDLLTNHTVLADVVNNGNGEPVFLPNENLSLADVGFSGYKSVLIIPIHLHYKMGVNIGAIILHHKTQENAYSDIEIVTVWQTFVERLTFFIQQHHQTRRDQLSFNARIDLLQKSAAADQLTEEYEIIWEITQQIRQWYREDRLFIIMKHLLDVDSYVFAYNSENSLDEEVVENFRLQPPITPEKLTRIVGSQEIVNKLRPEKSIHAKGLILSQDEIRTEGIDADCQSWLGITFYHPLGFALGHIILHNPTPHVYSEVESRFFSNFADLLGIVLAGFRGKQKEKTINDIKQGIIEQEESEENEVYYSRCENSLCNTVSTFLGKIYGVHSLLIARIDRRTQQFVTVLNQGNIAFDQEFQSVARAHVDELRIPLPDDVMQDLRNHAKKLTVEYPEGSGNKYLIAPMLVEHTSSVDDRQIIGCFITKAKRAGGLTAKAIDETSNALAYRVMQFDRSRRFDIINQFSKEVAELKPNNLTQQDILNIAHRHIKEIMFGDNLYISLYDKHKQEISFPLMYVNGEIKEQASRIINPDALGRTEEIILTKKPLRHRTKVESKAWYEMPRHGEFMGNHLASWIGVPIFSPDGIQGVIAAYHPNFDAIYSKLDLFFLSDIATQVSSLLRSLELSEANRKLEYANTDLQEANRKLKDAQTDILEKEGQLSVSLLAQDITHRLNNSLGSISITINETISAIQQGNAPALEDAVSLLNDSQYVIKTLINEIRQITSFKEVSINICELSNKLLLQIRKEKRLPLDIVFREKYPNHDIRLRAIHRSLSNCIHIVLENAAFALKEKYESLKTIDALYLEIAIKEEDHNIVVDIVDNGEPIPSSIRSVIFEAGVTGRKEGGGSGYGLWRAAAICSSMGGKLELIDDNRELKNFRMTLPQSREKHEKNVFIIDDEKSWLKILSRWFVEAGYTVETAASLEDARRLLFASAKEPDIVSLDISLDMSDSNNSEGLSIIDAIKEKHKGTKIIVISGFIDIGKGYMNDVDLTLEKIGENGPITKDNFISSIRQLEERNIDK